jgi:hypothetical protein
MTLRQLLKWVFWVIVLIFVLRFVVNVGQAAGWSIPNPIVWMDQAANNLGRMATSAVAVATDPAEDANVRAADAPQATAVMTGTLPRLSSEALGILSEVDEAIKIQDKTPAYRDFRFGVKDLDQRVAAAMVFDTDGAIKMRVACDDTCTGFYLVSQDGEVTALKPDATYGPNFNYQALDANALATAAEMGINTTDSEILAQHLFYTEISVKLGDQLIVDGNDDAELGVNRGVFSSWTWAR